MFAQGFIAGKRGLLSMIGCIQAEIYAYNSVSWFELIVGTIGYLVGPEAAWRECKICVYAVLSSSTQATCSVVMPRIPLLLISISLS